MSILFSKPPINEVAIGKSFEHPEGFYVPYYGKFWELVEDDFPICKEAPRIVDDPLLVSPESLTAITPRTWFLNNDETRLIQLQSDRFFYNWRQTGKGEEYHRFANIYDEYRKYSGLLPAFFESQFNKPLVTKQCHLTYVNLFRKGRDWNELSEISGLFRHICFPDEIENGKFKQSQLKLEYDMGDNEGKIVVSIATSARVTTESEIATRMEIAASSSLGIGDAAAEQDWFEKAHVAIIKGFCDLTSEEAQKNLWGRIE